MTSAAAVDPPEIEPRSARATGYAENVVAILERWSLLAGTELPCGVGAALRSQLCDGDTSDAARNSAARLCADGSPVEFCERLDASVGGPACTIDCGPAHGHAAERIERACALIEACRGRREASGLCVRLAQRAEHIRALWVGIDTFPARVRLYVDIARDANSTQAQDTKGTRAHDTTFSDGGAARRLARALSGSHASDDAAAAIDAIAGRGRLRVVGIDCDPHGGNVKLAFALGLDEPQLLEFARSCDLASEPFVRYVRHLAAGGNAWQQRRCGLGVALEAAGRIGALTLYHYAAPYSRDDAELRSRALALARTFGWSTDVYRGASRLLDDPWGTRVRQLVGFTVRHNGDTALRVYSRSGHLA